MDERSDPLWQLLHDADRPLRRRVAWLVWTYEHAPLRDILIGPEGVYLLDGMALTAARVFIELPMIGAECAPPEPISSGGLGNVVFVCAWLVLFASIFLILRAFC